MSRTYSVDILVGTRGTEAVETELLVRVAFPAHGRANLDRQNGNAVGKNLELVLFGLSVKDLEARNRDNTGDDAVVLLQVGSSLSTLTLHNRVL